MTAKTQGPLGPLSPEQNEMFHARISDLVRRVVRDGSVPYSYAMSSLQMVAENRFVPPAAFLPNRVVVADLGRTLQSDRIDAWLDRGGKLDERTVRAILSLAIPEAYHSGIWQFVGLSVGNLGFKKGCQWTTAFRAGLQLGFQYCPASMALAIRSAYTDQPLGEELLLAMSPLERSGFEDEVFKLSHTDQGMCLSLEEGPFYGEREMEDTSSSHLRADDLILFMRKR